MARLPLLLFFWTLTIYAKPPGLSKEAIETFVLDGQMSERELLLLKGRLRRLSSSHIRVLDLHTKSPIEAKAAIAFSQDHNDEEVNQNKDTEEAINERAGLSEYLYQGDILLTPEQILRKLRDGREPRAALPQEDSSFAKWDPERIPYYFDPSVRKFFFDFKRLQLANEDDKSKKFWISIGRERVFASLGAGHLPAKLFSNSRCLLAVGVTSVDFRNIKLSMDIRTSEIMHALGFQHEHIRRDRDGYIVVNYQNIWKNDSYNYDKDLRGDYQGFEYELGSIMHYGDVGDAFNLQASKIYTRDYKQILTIGNRMFPTFQDIAQINKYYNCSANCIGVPNYCRNGGVPHVNNCSSCLCPHGFAGRYCTDLESSTVNSTTCGGILEAKVGKSQSYTGQVRSEIWQKFMVERCFWHIRAPPGRRVKIFVTAQDLHCTAGCPWSALEVREGNFHKAGTRKCCTAGTSYDYYTSVDNLIVIGLYVKTGEVSVTWNYRAE